jgi:hypothetical protein
MNSALKMPFEVPKMPGVPGQPNPETMKNVNYSNGISEQFNNILDQRSKLMNYQPTPQYSIPAQQPAMPYPVPQQQEQVAIAPEPEAPAADPVAQYLQQNVMPSATPQVQVVRRSLTIAEVGVLFLAAVLTVSGVQALWSIAPKPVVNIEWRR